ncbi:MAG: peptidoglycan DD-metalloendopeptidase family protein [bacterium]|nr:peptidoglycan DD-metalloendopeptidase family protein [bacterium]
MALLLNKDKKPSIIRIAGLTFILASFLLIPNIYVLAQVDIDTTETKTVDPTTDITEESTVDELNSLNRELAEKKEQIDELAKKTELYQNNIKVKQQEALTLQGQMQILDLQVAQTENDIETVKAEMDKVEIELNTLEITIAEKDQELEYRKELLADFIRLIDEQDQQGYLEIFIGKESFSDFFDDLRYTQDLQDNVSEALTNLKESKQQLEAQQTDKQNKKNELTDLSGKLSGSIVNLGSQKEYKTVLLDETKEDEETFTVLLDEALKEQQAATGEINYLESRVRDKLAEGGIDLNIDAVLMWPISPLRGISAYFHDPTYPYRRLFEHPAIDIPASQGTDIRASESGYVARAKNAGLGYSYIMIVHNNELSTVYGHVSRIDVAEDEYVVRGQVIGAVGGTPGTPGAGRLTTGPHLHFEVRSGGIPVNPLDYLP